MNKPEIPLTKAVAGTMSEQPEPEASWHPLAAGWYRSLADSGQSKYYEASDWALARLVAEAMTRDLQPERRVVGDQIVEIVKPIPAASINAWLKAATALLATEGDRRRLSLELKRAEAAREVPDGVADFAAYQERLAGSG